MPDHMPSQLSAVQTTYFGLKEKRTGSPLPQYGGTPVDQRAWKQFEAMMAVTMPKAMRLNFVIGRKALPLNSATRASKRGAR